MSSIPTEAVTAEIQQSQAVPEAQQQIAKLMGLKHPGTLQSVQVDLVVVLQMNDQRFSQQKADLSAVALAEGDRNLYSPFKSGKKEGTIPGVMRNAIPEIVQAVDQINKMKMTILGESRSAICKAVDQMVDNLAVHIRSTITNDAGDVSLVSDDDSNLTLGDYVKVGTWNTPSPIGVITPNNPIIGITIQVPELYDTEMKKVALARIYKFLQNVVKKFDADVNILLAVAMNVAFLEDEGVREFANDLHDDNYKFYTKFDLFSNPDKRTWIPKFKTNIETYLLPTDEKTFETGMLFIKAVADEVEESTDASAE